MRPLVNGGLLGLWTIMTFGTLQFVVLSDQLVSCIFLVIELQVRLPFFETVTGIAVLLCPFSSKAVNIVFFVAAHAACLFSNIANIIGPDRFLGALRFVTLDAVDLRVLSLKPISRFRVIKSFVIHFC